MDQLESFLVPVICQGVQMIVDKKVNKTFMEFGYDLSEVHFKCFSDKDWTTKVYVKPQVELV